MTRLSGADHRKILDVLWTIGDAAGTSPIPDAALSALRELVPCDVVTFHRSTANGERELSYVGEPLGVMTDELRAVHRRYDHQDPLLPARGARTLTDCLTRRAYQRRELYQQVDRPLGIDYMMRLWLAPFGPRPARLEFDRSDRDFSERDRAVLNVLLPHLEQHCRHILTCDSAPSRPTVTARQGEIMELVARGLTNGEIASTLSISPETVRKHLENVYRRLGVHTRTGAVAALNQVRV